MVICSICLEEVRDTYTEVPGCGHRFHPGCLSTWCLQKPACPLCTVHISQVQVHQPQTTFTKIVHAAVPESPEANLDCLDHNFFGEELGKLRRIASGVKLARLRKRGVQTDPSAAEALLAIQSRIESLLSANRSMQHFSPQALMQEIADLNKSLQDLKSGTASVPVPLKAVYGSEDFADIPDDSDEDLDYDEDEEEESY